MNANQRPPARIAAVPQQYAGVRFRSTLEADWACTFDFHGIVWSYEPEAVELSDGRFYRCDFWLPGQRAWVEVKGPHEERIDKPAQLFRDLGCDPDDRNSPIVLICRWPERDGGPVERADGEPIAFSLCARCENYTFVDLHGSRQCRSCGFEDKAMWGGFNSPLLGFLSAGKPRSYTASLQFQRVERKPKEQPVTTTYPPLSPRACAAHEKRRTLMAAGWMQDCRYAPKGKPRKPERWHSPQDWAARDFSNGQTLGQAYKAATAVSA